MKSFILRATYKDETRNITFAEDGNWPAYGEIQAKLRTTFSLPGATCLYLWHVYFSPNDDVGECKFRRHVCSAEEYDDASAPLIVCNTFPRPTLIFQVLLSTDPRLATAQKYHQSTAYSTARSVLSSERQITADAVSRCAVVVSALKNKSRACSSDDLVGQRFWSERVQEKQEELNGHVDKMKSVEMEVKALESNAVMHKSAVEKETQRNKEAKAEVMNFLNNWEKRVQKGEADVAPFSIPTPTKAASVEAAPTTQASKQIPNPTATPQVEPLINFSDPADAPLPEPVQQTTRQPIAPPVQAFPSLESILAAATRPSRANPTVGTTPLPAVGLSYSQLANQLRTVAVPAVEATGERVTGEIKNILDGFLLHLGGQLDAFEGGLKAQYSNARQSVDEGLKKVDEVVVKATFSPSAATATKEKKSTSKSSPSKTKDTRVPAFTPAENHSMPGAFQPRHFSAEGKEQEVKPKVEEEKTKKVELDDEMASLIKAIRHRYKICDGCGEKPVGMCYKCETCPDFDLCANCLPRLQTSFHPSEHTFIAIPHSLLANRITPAAAKNSKSKAISEMSDSNKKTEEKEKKEVSHNASCDGCQGRIKGIRYKCLDCPDWDACGSCFESLDEIHPHHSFVKIHRKEDYIMKARAGRQAEHPRVVCDNCQHGISGARFKCMHPECRDFDLCASCESSPNRTHPMDHPLLKMVIPGRVESHSFFDNGVDGPPQPAHPMFGAGPGMPPAQGPSFAPRARGPWRESGNWPHHRQHHHHPGFGHGPGFGPGPGPRGFHPANGVPVPPFVPMNPTPFAGGPPGVPPFRHMGMGGPHGGPPPRMDFGSGAPRRSRGCRFNRGMAAAEEEPLSHFHPAQDYPREFEQKEEVVENTACASGPHIEAKDQEDNVKAEENVVDSFKSTHEVPPYSVTRVVPVAETPAATTEVNATTAINESDFSVAFVEDVTVPDGFPLAPSTQFIKIWKLKNTGTSTIPRTCTLKYVGGENFGMSVNNLEERNVKLSKDVGPGEEFNVSVSLRTPDEVGRSCVGYWRMAKPDGETFGHRLWTEIKVVDAERESSLSSSSVIMPNMGNDISSGPTVCFKGLALSDEMEEPTPSMYASASEVTAPTSTAKVTATQFTAQAPVTMTTTMDPEIFSPISNAQSFTDHDHDQISTTSWDDSDEEVMRVPGGLAAGAVNAQARHGRDEDEEAFSDDDFELLENGSDEE